MSLARHREERRRVARLLGGPHLLHPRRLLTAYRHGASPPAARRAQRDDYDATFASVRAAKLGELARELHETRCVRVDAEGAETEVEPSSCPVAASGAQLVVGAGRVTGNLEVRYTVTATDPSGNTASAACVATYEGPDGTELTLNGGGGCVGGGAPGAAPGWLVAFLGLALVLRRRRASRGHRRSGDRP